MFKVILSSHILGAEPMPECKIVHCGREKKPLNAFFFLKCKKKKLIFITLIISGQLCSQFLGQMEMSLDNARMHRGMWDVPQKSKYASI